MNRNRILVKETKYILIVMLTRQLKKGLRNIIKQILRLYQRFSHNAIRSHHQGI